MTYKTYKEAYDLLIREHIEDREWTQQSWEAQEMLGQLVERHTPKKPILEADGYADGELVYDTWVCPNCDTSYEVDFDDYDFCPNCGQAIEWSEVD